MFRFEDMPLSSEVVKITVVWLQYLEEAIPEISDMHFELALISEHGRFWLSVFEGARRVADENRRQIEERIAVKRCAPTTICRLSTEPNYKT